MIHAEYSSIKDVPCINDWKIYHCWFCERGTKWHSLLGTGSTETKAWNDAWQRTQSIFLAKLEL